MKKILLLLLLTTMFGTAYSQLYVGVGGLYGSSGITNQNTYGQADLDYQLKPCWGINVPVGYNFTDNLGIKMEFGYIDMGQKYEDTNGDSTTTRDIDMNYFVVPILFKYNTSGKVARFYVQAGPQMGLLLSAAQSYLGNGIPVPPFVEPETGDTVNVSESDITSRYSAINIFGRLDLGVDISITKSLIVNAGLSMAYGLIDLNSVEWRYNNSDGDYNPSHSWYGGVNVGICYRFDFKK